MNSDNLGAIAGFLTVAATSAAVKIAIDKGLLFQKPRIVDYTDSLDRNSAWPIGDKRDITGITFHNTDTPVTWSPERISLIHTNERGWPGIGYDYLVYPHTIYQVNRVASINWHNGVDNRNEVGVAAVGRLNQHPMPPEQMARCIKLIRWLKRRKDLPNMKYLSGHREKKSTTCPGRFVKMNLMRDLTNMEISPNSTISF